MRDSANIVGTDVSTAKQIIDKDATRKNSLLDINLKNKIGSRHNNKKNQNPILILTF